MRPQGMLIKDDRVQLVESGETGTVDLAHWSAASSEYVALVRWDDGGVSWVVGSKLTVR